MRHVPGLDLGQVLGDVETVEILVPGHAIDHTGQLHVKIVLGHIQPRERKVKVSFRLVLSFVIYC